MILLMGIAGSGKGTQGKLLGSVTGYHVISTGELLRKFGSDEQHDRMHKGELMSDQEMTDLLEKALGLLDEPNKTILDGYPRTIKQAQWLLENRQKDGYEIEFVLHLVASREAVKTRLHERARPDDHDEAIEARFREFEDTTLPIIDLYAGAGIDVIEVDGEQSIEQVHREIIADVHARQDS